MTIPVALTIAGSDPSGGAGVQADLKTFHQHRVYGAAAITLITVQSTRGVFRVEALPADLVSEQVHAVVTDLAPAAIKTGALGSAEVVEAVAAALMHVDTKLVVDPVMISKHGARLLDDDAIRSMLTRLLPLAFLVTPNAEEASAMTGLVVRDRAGALLAARALAEFGPRAVLVKGGHLDGEAEATDVLFVDGRAVDLSAPRVDTKHTHGTGCSFAAAITARLAAGAPLEEAVADAKAWLTAALANPPRVGSGIGPIDHHAPPVRRP